MDIFPHVLIHKATLLYEISMQFSGSILHADLMCTAIENRSATNRIHKLYSPLEQENHPNQKLRETWRYKKWAFLPNSLRRYWLSAVGFLSPDHFTPVAMATPFTASSPSFFFPFPFPFPIAAFPDISAQRSLLIQPLPLFAVCDHMTINCNYDVILVAFPGWKHWPYDLGNETLQIVLNMASLEDQALERKARLKALRAKKEGKQDSQVREYERI